MLNLLTALDIKDLGGSVAASGNKTAIAAESNTANNTLVGQIVHKLDVKVTADSGVEDSIPVITFAFQVRRESINREVHELIATGTKFALELVAVLRHCKCLLLLGQSRRRGRTRHRRRAGVWIDAVLLRGRGTTKGTSCVCARLARAGGCCGLGRLRAVT